MAVTRYYAENAATLPDSDGTTHFDANTTAPISGSITSANINSTAFTECLTFGLRPGAATVDSTNVPVQVDIQSISGTVEIRFRMKVGTTSYAVGSTYTTTGIKSETLTVTGLGSLTATDWVRLSVEIRRTGGHGNVSCQIWAYGPSYFDLDTTASSRRRVMVVG